MLAELEHQAELETKWLEDEARRREERLQFEIVIEKKKMEDGAMFKTIVERRLADKSREQRKFETKRLEGETRRKEEACQAELERRLEDKAKHRGISSG